VASLCRDLIALRRSAADLRHGTYSPLPSPPGVWVFRRGGGFVVALNFSNQPARLGGLRGRVRIGTVRSRDGELVTGASTLGPWEGVIIEAA
jgi:hypothetical protein